MQSDILHRANLHMNIYVRGLVQRIEVKTGVSINNLLLAVSTSLLVFILIGWKTLLLLGLGWIGIKVYSCTFRKPQDVFTEKEIQICSAFEEVMLFMNERKQQLLLQVDLIRIDHQNNVREKSLKKKNLLQSRRESESLAKRFKEMNNLRSTKDIDKSIGEVTEQLKVLSKEMCPPSIEIIFNNNPVFACISQYGLFQSQMNVFQNFESLNKYAHDVATQTQDVITQYEGIQKDKYIQTDLITLYKKTIPLRKEKQRDYTILHSPIGFIGEFGAEQFESPAAICLDTSTDLLYIADSGKKNKVHLLSKHGHYVGCVTLEESSAIWGVTVCEQAIFISNMTKVCKYTLTDFKLVKSYSNVKDCRSITSGGNEIFVAEKGKVSVLDNELNKKRIINLNSDDYYALDVKLAIDRLYVLLRYNYGTEGMHACLYRYNSINGDHIDNITIIQGTGFDYYRSFCLDNSMNCILTSFNNSQIEIYRIKENDRNQMKFEMQKTLNTSDFDCRGPISLTIDDSNNIFALFTNGIRPLVIL